jgi:hypothetical protein
VPWTGPRGQRAADIDQSRRWAEIRHVADVHRRAVRETSTPTGYVSWTYGVRGKRPCLISGAAADWSVDGKSLLPSCRRARRQRLSRGEFRYDGSGQAFCSWVIGSSQGVRTPEPSGRRVRLHPPHRPSLQVGHGTVPTMSARCRAGDTDGESGRRRPPRHAVPAIGRGRRHNPSDRASAQASRPPSHPSRSHRTPHRARDIAVGATKTAPQGRPMTTATHRHESITAGRIGTALTTSTVLTRVDDTLLRASSFRLTRRDRYLLRLLYEYDVIVIDPTAARVCLQNPGPRDGRSSYAGRRGRARGRCRGPAPRRQDGAGITSLTPLTVYSGYHS